MVNIGVFNLGDMLGRILPFAPIKQLQCDWWTERGLIKFAVIEIIFIPLLMLTAVPGGQSLTYIKHNFFLSFSFFKICLLFHVCNFFDY